MEIIVRGQHFKVTNNIRDFAQRKLKKCSRFFPNIQKIIAELRLEKTRNKKMSHICRITAYVSRAIFRAQEKDADMFTAIDKVMDKIEKQLVKHNQKIHTRKKGQKLREKGLLKGITTFLPKSAKQKSAKIQIAQKKFSPKPMDPIEAVLQLKVSQNPFYIFLNKLTKEINVVYARNNDKYGLLISKREELSSERFKQFIKKLVKEGHKNGGPKLIKTKPISSIFSSPAGAVDHMSQANEDFCVYRNDVEGDIQVLYRRRKKYFLYRVA